MMNHELPPLVRIVDDEETVRNSERFIFSIIGLESVTYASAEEFLEKDDPKRPGCIVLDVRMQGMSGLELQQALMTKGNDLPIVFLSGHGTVNTAVFALKRGAYDFLEKPVKPEKLQKIVQDLIVRNIQERRIKAKNQEIQKRYDTLTERERDVIAMVARGALNKQIAFELGIAEHTVKIHRGNALFKLQIRSAVDAYESLCAIGIIKPEVGACK